MDRPQKPSKDFPLFPHPNGQWAKKVKGKPRYYGSWRDDPTGVKALALYEGGILDKDVQFRISEGKDNRRVTIGQLCEDFKKHKKSLYESEELSNRTIEHYEDVCRRVCNHLRENTLLTEITPNDFQRLRESYSSTMGLVSLSQMIQWTRVLFNYAHKSGLVEKPIRYGPGFDKPSAKALRLERASKGSRMLEAQEIRLLLENARLDMRGMILLGINGGLGNTDLANLTSESVQGEWLLYPRVKTGVMRKIPLWEETVANIQEVTYLRENSSLLFRTRWGRSYKDHNKAMIVSAEFRRLCERVGIEGHSFYDLRRTFQTIGEESGDLVAVQSIMGHCPKQSDMSAVYRQRISDERLKRVTDKVREWLNEKTP